MKSIIKRIVALVAAFGFGATFFVSGAYADESSGVATSISISPVSKVLTLEAGQTYDNIFKVTNSSSSVLNFEVYAAPYSYNYSESDDEYKLGFNRETAFTQIVRWTSFLNTDGEYVEKAKYAAEPGTTVEVHYRITTPASIPAGGQYEVLFAHALSDSTNASGIKVEASPGLVVYGRSEGETVMNAEISDSVINRTIEKDGENHDWINAAAKVKNNGNVDFLAKGTLKITGIFGQVYYETPEDQARASVIPEAEVKISDTWEETPFFGIFNAAWSVTLPDGTIDTVNQTIAIFPPIIIIFFILLLTIIIVCIIISVRKRSERRKKFTV